MQQIPKEVLARPGARLGAIRLRPPAFRGLLRLENAMTKHGHRSRIMGIQVKNVKSLPS